MAAGHSHPSPETRAETLRASGGATDHRLEAIDRRLDALDIRLGALSGQIQDATRLVRGLTGGPPRRDEELRQHRNEVRQMLRRQEQSDARFKERLRRIDEQMEAIRRRLDQLEGQMNDGGRPAA